MDMAFIFPWSQLYLWLGAAIVTIAIIAVGLRFLERFRTRRIERFVDFQLAPRLLSGVDERLRPPLVWLTVLGFSFMAATLAQPHWGKSWEQSTQRSHDIIVCLDISESMLANSPMPNRLVRAKQKIGAIMDKSFGDRFGLVAFSGAAELMCPLTLDHGYFRMVLAAVNTDSVSLEGTDISASLKLAMATFQDQDEELGDRSRYSRAILLISDGEAVSGETIAVAKEASKYARIFVIGVGDPRGTEVVYRNRFAQGVQLAAEDYTHFSKLDESTLQRIAIDGQGGYIRATATNADVDEISGLIAQLLATDTEGDIRHQLVNRFQWPLAAAVICFMAEGFWLVMLPYVCRYRERRNPREEEANYA